ncbi:MAG TPA: winged helix-turn-helix domain-containing protein, partial [Roseiflexaceae bacterium]|nr:winged helix-turn-helix domain-containing protein [Roseiflexaceae bacterium]
MGGRLHIMTLGPLRLIRDGVPLPAEVWRSQPLRRLLGVLLSARGRTVSAHQLIEWLWPDADRPVAPVTLRSVVSQLRMVLAGEPGGRAACDFILTRPGGYAWNDT